MTISDRIEYHLYELEIARSPSLEEHVLPDVHDDDRVILDIGCGIGQTLIGLELGTERTLIGVDIEHEPLVYGRDNFDSINFTHCTAEALPFADDSFDLIFSRVALPYTDIPKVLAETTRVLKPGGRIWLTLHPAAMTFVQLRSSIVSIRIKQVVFRSYVLFNGLLFHFFGKLVTFPVNKRIESFQTEKSIVAALEFAGFRNIRVERNRHFVVTASKSNPTPVRAEEPIQKMNQNTGAAVKPKLEPADVL